MDWEIWRQLANQTADANILHDRCINSRGDNCAQVFFRLRYFVREDKCVESDITFHTAPMEEFHQCREIGLDEIVSAHPGIEPIQPEIDRVRAVLDGRLRAFPITSGSEEFGESAECRVRSAE
jgi:hypothetical protein